MSKLKEFERDLAEVINRNSLDNFGRGMPINLGMLKYAISQIENSGIKHEAYKIVRIPIFPPAECVSSGAMSPQKQVGEEIQFQSLPDSNGRLTWHLI